MLVFMVTKDDFDRYGIWKTFLGSKQPSLTQMLEFGKWAVFKPIGLLMQATIIDFNTEDDTLESNDSIELSPGITAPELTTTLESPQAPPPPPPAPPPPPCPDITNTIDEKEPRCKKMNWKELRIDLKNTIWEKVNLQLSSINDIIDKNELLELFRERPRKSMKFSVHSPTASNSEEIQAIAGKKQLNISIALAHHQLTADSLLSAVNNVDIRMLEPDFISSFESILPDQKEEASLLQKFSSETFDMGDEILTDPEIFAYLLSRVPDFRKKIRAMAFQCSFYDRVNAICKNLDIVREASKEIRKSHKLQIVLMYILTVGRIINNTTTKAFNIDFLAKASCFKTTDGEANFLMYLVQKLTLNDADVLAISEELPNLHNAAKVSLNDIDRDSTELAVEYASIALELDSITEESKIFKEFVRQGKFDLNHLKRKRRQVQHELKDLSEYFGIDTVKSKPMEVFITVKQFIKDLTTASEKLTKKALSRRNSSRTMVKSASTSSLKRSSRNSSFRGSRNSSTKSSRNSSARSSIRRAFRSNNVASAGFDMKSRDEKDSSPSNLDDGHPSKSSSSEISRAFQYKVGTATILSYSDRKSNRSGLSRNYCFIEDSRERPKEPDLEKYRSLMREYEEKRSTFASSEKLGKASVNQNKDNSGSFEKEKLNKNVFSSVRETAHTGNKLELDKGICKDRKSAQVSITEKHILNQIAKSSEAKGVDERKLSREDQRKPAAEVLNRKIKESGPGKGDKYTLTASDKEIKSYRIRENASGRRPQQDIEIRQNGETVMEKWEQDHKRDESKILPSTNEKLTESKTLYYKEKNLYSMETYRHNEARLIADDKRHETENDVDQRIKLEVPDDSHRKENGYERIGLHNGDVGSLDEGLVKDYSNSAKQRNIPQRVDDLNGNQILEGFNSSSCWREDLHKYEGNSVIRSAMEDNDIKSDHKITAKIPKAQKSFMGGSARSSFTLKRNSFRNSLRKEKGTRMVNVKAVQVKDIEQMNTSSRSGSNTEHGRLQRRRTKSEGIQTVTLKSGFIAKAVPIKLELTSSPSSSMVDETTRSQKADNSDKKVIKTNSKIEDEQKCEELMNGRDAVADKRFDFKEKDGPVLRRTKSAVINRNLREAKLIFLL